MKKLFSAIMAIAMAVTFVVARTPSVVMAENLSGTYYIKNMEAHLYVSTDSESVNDVAKTKILDIHRDQAWVIQQDSSGYYTVKLSTAELYLSVANDSSTTGIAINLQRAPISDEQLWSISSMNGGYKFSPKTASGYLMGTSPGSAPSNNSALMTVAYRADGYNYELWTLNQVTNTLYLDLKYDESYRIRYSSNYEDKINNCANQLKYRLFTSAGISVLAVSEGTEIDLYTDSASGCAAVSANNYNVVCSCGTCVNSTSTSLSSYHHTNINNVLYRLTNNNSVAVRVVFTGREMCYKTSLNHVNIASDSGCYYKVWKERDVALIKDFDTRHNHDAVVLMVAILNLYGLPGHPNSGNTNCVLGPNADSSSVRDDCPICSSCLDALRANADEYNN